MTRDYYARLREIEEHVGTALYAGRTEDAQTARAALRSVMVAAELATRELGEVGRG